MKRKSKRKSLDFKFVLTVIFWLSLISTLYYLDRSSQAPSDVDAGSFVTVTEKCSYGKAGVFRLNKAFSVISGKTVQGRGCPATKLGTGGKKYALDASITSCDDCTKKKASVTVYVRNSKGLVSVGKMSGKNTVAVGGATAKFPFVYYWK